MGSAISGEDCLIQTKHIMRQKRRKCNQSCRRKEIRRTTGFTGATKRRSCRTNAKYEFSWIRVNVWSLTKCRAHEASRAYFPYRTSATSKIVAQRGLHQVH